LPIIDAEKALNAAAPLAALRERALDDYLKSSKTPHFGEWAAIPLFPLMRYGSLDLSAVQRSEYMTS